MTIDPKTGIPSFDTHMATLEALRNLRPGQRASTYYPFVEMGDALGKLGPLRVVEVLAYDGDKYVTVRLPNGVEREMKAGYLELETLNPNIGSTMQSLFEELGEADDLAKRR